MPHVTSLDMFSDENIYARDGTFHDGGEKIANLKSQILQLLSSWFPAAETKPPSIKFLGQGAFNMVVGVRIEPKSIKGDNAEYSASVSRLLGVPPKPQTFALRIPVPMESAFGSDSSDSWMESEAESNINQDVAALHVINQRLTVPMPRIIEYDLTSANPLGQAYMLQSYVAGESLRTLWEKLNKKQKVSAVQQLTRIIEKIASVSTKAAGQIAFSNVTSPDTEIKLDELLIPTSHLTGPAPGRCEAYEETPHDFMILCCSRWIRYEERSGAENSFTTSLWGRIMDIIDSLNERGWFGDRFHLMHGDLYPRNILAEIASDTTVNITGIVDWDMACLVPKVVALRAPLWAWQHMVSDLEEDQTKVLARDVHGEQLKDAFLKTASREYATMAFAEEGIVARKLYSIVTEGLLEPQQRELALELIYRWDKIRPSGFSP